MAEFVLRAQIRGRIIDQREAEFAALDAWIYDAVFATPRSDARLGLMPRSDFYRVAR